MPKRHAPYKRRRQPAQHGDVAQKKHRKKRSEDPMAKVLDQVVGEFIGKLADQVGGQSELGRRAKISQSQISRIISGDRSLSWLNALQLAQAGLIVDGKPLTLERLLGEIAARIWTATQPGAHVMTEREIVSATARRTSPQAKGALPTPKLPKLPRRSPEDEISKSEGED